MITIDGITMKDMGEMSPVRAWFKYQDISTKLDKSGIYAIKLCDEVVYIGQSCSLFSRLLEHCVALFSDKPSSELKYKLLRNFYKDMSWSVLMYEDVAMLTDGEDYYINKYKPIFNIQTPYGEQHFWGTQEDLEDFCYGLLTMDDLRSMIKTKKKTNKEVNLINIEDALDDTIKLPQQLADGIKTHSLHGNAVSEILKAIEFKNSEEKRMRQPCTVVIEIKDNRLIATSYLEDGKVMGQYMSRKRRIWNWKSRKIKENET